MADLNTARGVLVRWWNAPTRRRYLRGKLTPRNVHAVPKRERAKAKGLLKRRYGLTRRDMGAMGAGHREAPWT